MTGRELRVWTSAGRATPEPIWRRRRTGSVLVAATVLGGVALCAFSFFAVSRRRPQPRLRRRWFDARDARGWDKVDEASYGSFPASDPPGFYSGAAELR